VRYPLDFPVLGLQSLERIHWRCCWRRNYLLRRMACHKERCEDAAGALVGRIPCETLRSRTIDFYVGAKACVDSLQYYERLHDYYAANSDHNLRLEKWQQILEYSKQLKTMNVEFSKLYDALRPELDRYLSTTRPGL